MVFLMLAQLSHSSGLLDPALSHSPPSPPSLIPPQRLKREVTEGSAARATDLTDEELVRAFSERQGGGSGSSLLRSGPSGKHRGGSDRGGGGGGGGSGFGKGGKGGKGSWQHDAAGTGKQRHRSRNQNSDSEDSG